MTVPLCVLFVYFFLVPGNGASVDVRVFIGPATGGGHASVSVDGSSGAGGPGALFLGAFASEVVLPNLSAVNGVVHGIAGVMTYPGYKRPAVP